MNPFDQLHEIDRESTTVDPNFARRLRSQIEAALAPTIDLPTRKDTTMTNTSMTNTTMTDVSTSAVQILTPYIAVHDGVGALQWYADAMGATENTRFVGDDGRIGHADFTVSGANVMLSDAYPEIGVVAANSTEGSSCALHLEVIDVDSFHAKAVEHGATSLRDPADQPHGSRMSTIVDPYGIRWMLSTTLRTMTAAEINDAMEGFTVIEGPAQAGSPARPVQLGYYTIHTDDIARAANFYSSVLGWEVDTESGHVSNCDLPFGFQRDHGEGVRLWLQTKEPDAVIAKVLANGGTVVEDVMYESGRGVECRDDQGARFDLHDPAPGYE